MHWHEFPSQNVIRSSNLTLDILGVSIIERFSSGLGSSSVMLSRLLLEKLVVRCESLKNILLGDSLESWRKLEIVVRIDNSLTLRFG